MLSPWQTDRHSPRAHSVDVVFRRRAAPERSPREGQRGCCDTRSAPTERHCLPGEERDALSVFKARRCFSSLPSSPPRAPAGGHRHVPAVRRAPRQFGIHHLPGPQIMTFPRLLSSSTACCGCCLVAAAERRHPSSSAGSGRPPVGVASWRPARGEALILPHPLEQVQFECRCRCNFSCFILQTAMAGFSHLNSFTGAENEQTVVLHLKKIKKLNRGYEYDAPRHLLRENLSRRNPCLTPSQLP